MMAKPVLILDQYFRLVDELFSAETWRGLNETCEVVGGVDAEMPRDAFLAALPGASFVVAAHPALGAEEIAGAPKLKAVIEVSGAFQQGLDYGACFAHGIDVLSCAPGFRFAVAEMALGMILAGARGLVTEHEGFRNGTERWLADNAETDFTLFGQSVGFVGYGMIARETHRLLAPFQPKVTAHDPWLKAAEVPLVALETVLTSSRVVVITASPTAENRAMISAELVRRIPDNTLVVLVSRAHCVDFEALTAAALEGRIRLATDVYPDEPLAADHPIRRAPNVILSPHRAAAVDGGRRPIGDAILHDLRAILAGSDARDLKRADPRRVASLSSAHKELTVKPTA